ncbi:MAG: formylglycine-generating enzyme family protein [Verrucomicrobiales bacterium]
MHYYRGLLHSLRSGETGVSGEAMEAFLSRDLNRLDEEACRIAERQVAWALTHDLGSGEPLPDFLDPDIIRFLLPELECPPVLYHGDGIVIGGEKKCGRIVTPLREGDGACVFSVGDENRVLTQGGERAIEIAELIDAGSFGIANGADKVVIEKTPRPPWARRMWYDRHGLAAEFRVEGVPFVLRWIPPGRFLMGSPEDEPGRFDDEGPRHERIIEKGFWLGETVVTQAQWRVVMGRNPSHFKGPDTLPVEQVAWNDCRDYCAKLSSLIPGVAFRAPAEAEWEYACRAGTATALWTGGITIRRDYDAPELEEIAWYVGNSWRDEQVENPHGMGSYDWRHPDGDKAGTHAVKGKEANPWGLYDMLGNVWEWCADLWDAEAYAKFERGEPPVKDEDGAGRVVRGGSWSSLARGCRAASRSWNEPDFRRLNLGFRVAAGQEPSAAEPQGGGAPLPERRSRARRAGGSEPA